MSDSPVPAQPPRCGVRIRAVNLVTDAVTFLVALAMAATGLLLKFVLPPGSGQGGRGMQLWGFSRHEWGDVHLRLAVIMGALFILHVALHWNWLCATVGRCFTINNAPPGRASARQHAAYGAAFLVAVTALLFGFVWIARIGATRPDAQFERGGRGYRGGRDAAAVRNIDVVSPATCERGHRRVP